jgi:hypothetical protein
MMVTYPLPPIPPVAVMAMDADRAAMELIDSWIRADIAVTTVQATECAHATPQATVDTATCMHPGYALHC